MTNVSANPCFRIFFSFFAGGTHALPNLEEYRQFRADHRFRTIRFMHQALPELDLRVPTALSPGLLNPQRPDHHSSRTGGAEHRPGLYERLAEAAANAQDCDGSRLAARRAGTRRSPTPTYAAALSPTSCS